MKTVKIINNSTGREFGCFFENDSECDEWVKSCLEKGSWGKEKDLIIEIEDVTSQYTTAENYRMLREERDVVLKGLDYTQLSDAPFTSEEKKHFREYRQYLREMPNQHNDASIHRYNIMSFVKWRTWKYINK